jgi:hypothetical protein
MGGMGRMDFDLPVLYFPRFASLARHFGDEHALVGLLIWRLLAVYLALISCLKPKARRTWN